MKHNLVELTVDGEKTYGKLIGYYDYEVCDDPKCWFVDGYTVFANIYQLIDGRKVTILHDNVVKETTELELKSMNPARRPHGGKGSRKLAREERMYSDKRWTNLPF